MQVAELLVDGLTAYGLAGLVFAVAFVLGPRRSGPYCWCAG